VLGAAVSISGCGDDDDGNTADAGVADTSFAADAAYGGPPDSGVDAGPIGPDAAYGGPSMDSGTDAGN
jgi:hypothetical protein